MTTFEIIALISLTVIVGLLIGSYFIFYTLVQMKRWQESIWQELRGIRVNVADTAEYTHNHIAPDVEIISNNFLHLLDENPTKIDWNELSKQQQDEFRKWLQMVNINKLNKKD